MIREDWLSSCRSRRTTGRSGRAGRKAFFPTVSSALVLMTIPNRAAAARIAEHMDTISIVRDFASDGCCPENSRQQRTDSLPEHEFDAASDRVDTQLRHPAQIHPAMVIGICRMRSPPPPVVAHSCSLDVCRGLDKGSEGLRRRRSRSDRNRKRLVFGPVCEDRENRGEEMPWPVLQFVPSPGERQCDAVADHVFGDRLEHSSVSRCQ